MDGDPAVENGLDSFSLTFPLPYRVAFIVVTAVWAWALNLHYLSILHIDVPQLIRYPGRTHPSTQAPHHRSTYRLAALCSAVLGGSLVLFWLLTRRDRQRVVDYDWLPMLTLLVLGLVFALPRALLHLASRHSGYQSLVDTMPHSGRMRLLGTLRRVAVGGLAQARDGKFGDILLADVLTSYAKVLGDLYVSLCMFASPGGSSTARPDRNCGGVVVVPLLMALPSLIRLRQCLIEYGRVRANLSSKDAAAGSANDGWGGQHLANAAKYASAFPVIILSALMRSRTHGEGGAPQVTPGLYRAWLAAVLVNSLYSFYWDVAKDWDLTLFSPAREREAPDHAWGLRRRLMIHSANVYYFVVALDLLLRCTWSLKLSPHLDHVADFESSIFVVEFLEVFRRWVWIFFRVETEWIRTTTPTGLNVDDILLGDFQQLGNGSSGSSKYADDTDDED